MLQGSFRTQLSLSRGHQRKLELNHGKRQTTRLLLWGFQSTLCYLGQWGQQPSFKLRSL